MLYIALLKHCRSYITTSWESPSQFCNRIASSSPTYNVGNATLKRLCSFVQYLLGISCTDGRLYWTKKNACSINAKYISQDILYGLMRRVQRQQAPCTLVPLLVQHPLARPQATTQNELTWAYDGTRVCAFAICIHTETDMWLIIRYNNFLLFSNLLSSIHTISFVIVSGGS